MPTLAPRSLTNWTRDFCVVIGLELPDCFSEFLPQGLGFFSPFRATHPMNRKTTTATGVVLLAAGALFFLNQPLTGGVILTASVYQPAGDGDKRYLFRAIGDRAVTMQDGEVVIPWDSGEFAVDIICGESFQLTWPSIAGRSYQVEASGDLANWAPELQTFSGTGSNLTWHGKLEGEQQFFRVREL